MRPSAWMYWLSSIEFRPVKKSAVVYVSTNVGDAEKFQIYVSVPNATFLTMYPWSIQPLWSWVCWQEEQQQPQQHTHATPLGIPHQSLVVIFLTPHLHLALSLLHLIFPSMACLTSPPSYSHDQKLCFTRRSIRRSDKDVLDRDPD